MFGAGVALFQLEMSINKIYIDIDMGVVDIESFYQV
jgi:hypothetical protein